MLPQTYPPESVFLGYEANVSQSRLVLNLISLLTSQNPPISANILIPSEDVEDAYRQFSPLFKSDKSKHVNFITTQSEQTIWAQDYFEIATLAQTGETLILDLPYYGRDGEQLPAAVALACRLDMLSQLPSEPSMDSGDYGGNIEALPGSVVLIGNDMSQTTSTTLQTIFDRQSFLTLDVGWLDAGHVDEIITVVPLPTSSDSCSFALLYSSPTLGLELLMANTFNPALDDIAPQMPDNTDIEIDYGRIDFSECMEVLSKGGPATSTGQNVLCEELVRANQAYGTIIDAQVDLVLRKLEASTGCQSIRLFPMPQLYTPFKPVPTYGTPVDAALALNPSIVNCISLGKTLVISDQPYYPFRQYVENALADTGLELVFVESAFLHYLGGGIHCTVNIQRTCKPRLQPAHR